ncbi:hypothetical protein EGW08_013624 [Elysia chlorotica]|uniref:Uncharacterized protein n=1 Tax=Elysia chlorotica TaxID=188477 RepID=A0A3S0ZGV1_ELYCH|nr:hypothetical protein EGW08_013624 [Elysia chlorotica]
MTIMNILCFYSNLVSNFCLYCINNEQYIHAQYTILINALELICISFSLLSNDNLFSQNLSYVNILKCFMIHANQIIKYVIILCFYLHYTCSYELKVFALHANLIKTSII